MTCWTDQTGYTFESKEPPKRIISLVPSQTELLHYLGLNQEVIGITRFCVHPNHWFKSKKRVGGTKDLRHDRVTEMEPDLIIANKEENSREDIEQLRERYPVWTSDIKTLNDSLDMIQKIGALVGKPEAAEELCKSIQTNFDALSSESLLKKVLYLIWKDPYMAVGRDTFINDMLERAGFVNALKDPEGRYPELSVEQIETLAPDALLLSSEPFPFKGKHSEEVRQQFPTVRVTEVDGELFSWYGSRLLHSSTYFEELRTLI